MKHNWDHARDGISRCSQCGLEAPTWRVHKGGIPECDGHLIILRQGTLAINAALRGKHEKPPACMTGLHPVVSCFKCPARIKDRQCEELRLTHGYPPPKRN